MQRRVWHLDLGGGIDRGAALAVILGELVADLVEAVALERGRAPLETSPKALARSKK